jgi:FKBP-type peptidyl-prolyl cis-trans isomerase
MKKLVFGFLITMLIATGCKKTESCQDNTDVAPAAEEQMVVDYLTANGIVATKHKSNMYYQIINQGTGATPNPCSNVTVDYIGKLTSGKEFERNQNMVFRLEGLIGGWVQGIPLVQSGGSVRLIIPPSLAYGSRTIYEDDQRTVKIPGNSVLIFDISLKNVQ